MQDSYKFPSNFLVQYRAEFPIGFTLSVGPHDLNISFYHAYDKLFDKKIFLIYGSYAIWCGILHTCHLDDISCTFPKCSSDTI